MNTLFKILTGLTLTVLFACNRTVTHDKLVVQPDTSAHENILGDYLVDTVAEDTSLTKATSVKRNSKCPIDSFMNLSTKNLQPLLDRLEKSNLVTHNKVKEIPTFIMNFLKCSQGGDFSIANSSEDWQATDAMIEGKKLPDRQLIYFGLGDSLALMAHYKGGFVKSANALIFQFNDKKITNFWCGILWIDLKDKREIVEFINQHKNEMSTDISF